MISNILLTGVLASNLVLQNIQEKQESTPVVLASQNVDLSKRQPDKYVNDVFTHNILLNVAYINSAQNSNFTQDAVYEFRLKPNEVFAYHDTAVLDKYKGKVTKTTNAHFSGQEGFKSDGYLMGDGVCHLASLMYWVAKDANLEAEAPSNHDFADIQGIDRQYGVAIYSAPGSESTSANQNLYITNTTGEDIVFKFEKTGDNLKLSILAQS